MFCQTNRKIKGKKRRREEKRKRGREGGRMEVKKGGKALTSRENMMNKIH